MTAITLPANPAQQALFGQIMVDPNAQFYPSNWPAMPFHEGEIALQHAANVHKTVMSYAPRVIRPYMPEQHRAFYQDQPFMVVAARDLEGNMWSTLLTSPTGRADLVRSPDPVTLQFQGRPVKGDALAGALQPGSDMGLLGIELATKRRNRVNGRITALVPNDDDQNAEDVLVFSTDQSFGNCPQYIKPREWWTASPTKQTDTNEDESSSSSVNGGSSSTKSSSHRATELSNAQMQTIQQAETIFVATGYRGPGNDVRYGNDASHRGGPAGFAMVKDSKTLILPEFAGNKHFNSLGNLVKDSRMGVTIPSFEDGGMLQLSGRGEVDMDTEKAARTYPGALRLVTFHIEHVNEVPAGSLPVRWSVSAQDERLELQVTDIVQESADVKSFYLRPAQDDNDAKPLWGFEAGNHLPIQLRTEQGELLRTYSLSGVPGKSPDYYRISVKREPKGLASGFLHDKVSVGDTIHVNRPAGDFVLPTDDENTSSKNRTLVLLSSGVGVTPMLSMLHQIVENASASNNKARSHHRRKVLWIHGARNAEHHPFHDEVNKLAARASENGTASVTTHVAYSRPGKKGSTSGASYDSVGRINMELVESLVPDLKNAEYFMCGNGAFMANMEDRLLLEGVDPKLIHYETF